MRKLTLYAAMAVGCVSATGHVLARGKGKGKD